MGGADARYAAGMLRGPSRRLVLFGDTVGLPQLLRMLDPSSVVGLVGASIRPAQHQPLADLSSQKGLPLLLQPRPDEPAYCEFKNRLRDLAPDLFIINSYSMILRPDVLAVPRFGAVNVHGALLPQYRGANPTEWALINGERETGVTIHAVDDGIDTGPIIAQRKVPIHFDDTWVDVRRRLGAATERLLAETLPAILAGGARLQVQGVEDGRHHRRRTADDGCFDWALPAIEIYNLIRALVDPHPGASVQGETIKRWLPLAEILWRKHRAGHGMWSTAEWALEPRPPAERERCRADDAVILCVSRRGGEKIGQCRISGFAGTGTPLLAALVLRSRLRIATGNVKKLRLLIGHFADRELKRSVEFV